jgi:hypothetical protein
MTLKTKVDTTKPGDYELQNCDIDQKFNTSVSILTIVLKEKSRTLEAVKKASPLLSTVIQKRDRFIAKTENILNVWVHEEIWCHMPLSLRMFEAKASSFKTSQGVPHFRSKTVKLT